MHNRLFVPFILTLFITINSNFAICKESREIEKSFALKKDGQVAIDTYKGSITIETWNKNEVRVRVKIEADEWDSNADEKVENTEIIFHASKNSLKMETDYDKIQSRSSRLFSKNVGSLPLVHYWIKMPATAELKIDDYKSDTRITDLRAPIEFETYKGTVVVRGLEGSIDLETYKGDVEVEFNKISGDNRFETYKGNIEMMLQKNASFDVRATIGYKADFDSDFKLDVKRKGGKRSDRTYRGAINGGGSELYVETDKGDIRLLRR